MDYWEEAFCCALEEAGIPLPEKERLALAVAVLKGAHENYGMTHGHDAIPNPLYAENDRLEKELKKEREKRVCEHCRGRGRVNAFGPYHMSDSQCDKCRGEGKA